MAGSERIAVEIKRSTAPVPSRGFHLACDDVRATRRWLVYPGRERYAAPGGIEVLPTVEAMKSLGASPPRA